MTGAHEQRGVRGLDVGERPQRDVGFVPVHPVQHTEAGPDLVSRTVLRRHLRAEVGLVVAGTAETAVGDDTRQTGRATVVGQQPVSVQWGVGDQKAEFETGPLRLVVAFELAVVHRLAMIVLDDQKPSGHCCSHLNSSRGAGSARSDQVATMRFAPSSNVSCTRSPWCSVRSSSRNSVSDLRGGHQLSIGGR